MDLNYVYPFVGSMYRIRDTLLVAALVLLTCKLIQTTFLWIVSRRKRPPGPIGIPLFGNLPFLGEKPHETLWEMRHQYGDLISVHLGLRYTVVINSFKLAKEILCHPAALDKTPDLFNHLRETGFLIENGQPWLEQRRFCMSLIRDLGIGKGQWEDMIFEEVGNFIQFLHNTNGQPTDIHHTLGKSIASNVLFLFVGRTFTKDEADKVELSVQYSDMSLQYTGAANPATVVPGFRKMLELFKIAGYDKAAELTTKFLNLLKDEIERHKVSKDLQNVKDFINLYLEKWEDMMKSKNEKHSFSEKMLLGNVNTLFIGSSDTIFHSLLWALRIMAKFPHIQAEVHKELMNALGMEMRASYAERHKIPYTFAVIMEIQRYGTVLPMGPPRRLNQDLEVNGYTIPKGAQISFNMWAMHRDPDCWDRADEFIPERFFSKDGTKVNANPPGFMTFSIGKRDCPGRSIAEMEMLAYFTEIIKNFEITVESGQEVEFNVREALMRYLEPQKLRFVKRKRTV